MGNDESEKVKKNLEVLQNDVEGKEEKIIVTKEKEEKENAYVKTLLYLYPKLKQLAQNERDLAQTRAILSYQGKFSADKIACRVLDCFYREEFLLSVYKNLDKVVKEFSEEEKLILEYRYFRRKSKLKQLSNGKLNISQRTFYRKQKKLPIKFASKLKENGWNEQWFMENFCEDSVAMSVYKRILKGGEKGTCMPRSELQFSAHKKRIQQSFVK